MELRQLKYFVAIAEEGSVSAAADRLHTSQPSLGRQIRDLELEIGVPLLIRNTRGCVLTIAGQALLEQSRVILSQAEVAKEAARRAAQSEKQSLTVGFITGYEMEWFPKVIEIFRAQLDEIQLTVQSRMSPDLTQALLAGEIDVALLRADPKHKDLSYEPLFTEPLVAILPARHRLASRSVLDPTELTGELMISMSKRTGPTLRRKVDEYLGRSGVTFGQGTEAENLMSAVALVLSENAICIMPRYAKRLLPSSTVWRPLKAPVPVIEMSIGYRTLRTTPMLQLFLSKIHLAATFDDDPPFARL
jgi:LysR family transcriptional regulator, hca operon transcriptional activator